MKLAVLVLCCCGLTLSFRCQMEEALPNVTDTTFSIVPQRDADNATQLWITNMNVFLFGRLEENSDARIHAGFYDPSSSALVYKVIVSCRDNTWKTMYDKTGIGNNRKWKEGVLTNGCPAGDFDLIANIGCPHWLDDDEIERLGVKCAKQAFFLFNGQVLETDTVVDDRGRERAEELPVFIRKGRTFSAHVARTGAYFTHQSYGKCFAFPAKFAANCLAANLWMRGRDDRGTGLDYFGAWSMGYSVECRSYQEGDESAVLFKAVQTKIVPDGSAIAGGRSYKTCCCSYMDGHLDSTTCRSNYKTALCNNIEESRCSDYEEYFF